MFVSCEGCFPPELSLLKSLTEIHLWSILQWLGRNDESVPPTEEERHSTAFQTFLEISRILQGQAANVSIIRNECCRLHSLLSQQSVGVLYRLWALQCTVDFTCAGPHCQEGCIHVSWLRGWWVGSPLTFKCCTRTSTEDNSAKKPVSLLQWPGVNSR